MKLLLCFIVFLLAGTSALSQENPSSFESKEPTLTTQAPATSTHKEKQAIEFWTLLKKESLEHIAPGLGEISRYKGASGWSDVFVYDLGLGPWSDGLSDPKFANHFQSVLAEVRLYEERGVYKSLQMLEAGTLTVDDQPFQYQVMEYLYGEEPVKSAVLLTARNGKLLKFRITVYKRFSQRLAGASGSLIRLTLKNGN